MVNDTLSLLVLLASPAAMAGISSLLEKAGWFQALNANGKLFTVVGLSIVLAIGAEAAQVFITGNPNVLGFIDPYVKVALPALTFLFSQLNYGSRATASEKAIPAKAE